MIQIPPNYSSNKTVTFGHVTQQVPIQNQQQKDIVDLVTLVSESNNLKEVTRKGWLRAGVERPESVAAHSWSTAMLALLLTPNDMDINKTLKYALVHDLAEAHVGDITPYDGISREEKGKLETDAINKLCKTFPDLKQLWNEYHNASTPEAAFLKQIDRLDMGIQALLYGKRGHNISDFIKTCKRDIKHPTLKAVLDEVIRRIKIQNYKPSKTN